MASVKVAVRVRPFNQREVDMGAKSVIQMDGKKTRIFNNKIPENFKDFTFDHSYWSFNCTDKHFASQEQVFGELGKDVVDAAFEGYNACVFAYGQTGSGKTFTMTGTPDNQGLIPRICESLFGQMASGASYRTEVSYLEIYNERVKDLLHRDDNNAGHNLRVREHPQHGPYVSDLSRHFVSEYSHIKELMTRGNHYRTTASTNMNDTSSRSHAIFTLMFVQAGFSNDLPSETVSKIHLVDLAGSERADATGATGQRLKEGAHINKSLVTLGSVISALAELSNHNSPEHNTPVRKSTFIPYRDSVLTWLLKDSLGGNSKTIMIAAVSPADCNYSETLSTLRYANRAKNIINKPTINEDPNVKLIKELRDEISKLKSMLCNDYTVESQPQMLAALIKKEAQEKVLTEKWTEKWRETQKILQEQKALGLRKAGTGVVLDSDMPHLIGIDDDLLSTGVTLYHLKDGETSIGTEEAITKPDILLNGQDIEADHCSIVLSGGVATLIPHQQAQCWVNGVLIDKPTRLSQGCNILLGRTNMFRYNDPVEAEKLRKEGSRSLLNLSRLSLLSWSTPDLVVSNENLNVHSDDSEKIDTLEQQRTELLKEKEAFKIEQAEKEQGWEKEQRQKKEALEIAQKQLELERQQMETIYQEQCKRLAEDWERLEKHQAKSLASLRSKEAELDKRRQILQCERDEEMAAICAERKALIGVRGSVLKKNKEFLEFVSNKLQKVLSTNNNEVLKDDGFKSLLVLAAEKYCEGLQSSLCWSDVNLSSDYTSTSPVYFSSPIHSTSSDGNGWVNMSSAHTLLKDGIVQDIISHHKATLAGLESELRARAMSVCHREQRVNEIDKELSNNSVPSSSTPKCDSNFDNTKQSLSLRTNDELNHILRRKQNLSLELLPVTGDKHTSSPETCDTFHTASPSPPIMSDSGVGLGLEEVNLLQPHWIDDSDDASSIDESYKKTLKQGQNMTCYKPRMLFPKINASYKNQEPAEAVRALKHLMQQITRQRLMIMHSLESDIDTVETNKQINVLQEMKREFILLENQIKHESGKENIHSQEESDDLSTSAEDTNSDSICDSVKFYGSKHLEDMRRSSHDLPLRAFHDFRVQSPLRPILNFSSSSQQVDRLQTYNYALARSMPSLATSSGWDSNNDGNLDVSVPTYILRGAGSATHYAYEVRLRAGGECWAILRRYSKFRELHINMKHKYGSKVAALHFPPRRLFSRQAEWLARERRPQLEAYLKALLDLCMTIPDTPLYFAKNNLTKLSLHELSPFFRRGVFETGKHGTS